MEAEWIQSRPEDMAECMVLIDFFQRVAHPGRRGRIRILSEVRLVPARLASGVVASSCDEEETTVVPAHRETDAQITFALALALAPC